MATELHTLSIASLNTAGLPGRLPPVEERAVEICRFLEESKLDVVNLQEVWKRQYLDTFRRLLPSYPFFAWRRGLVGQPRGGLATFSRLPLWTATFSSFRGVHAKAGGLRFRARMRMMSAIHGVLMVELPTVGAVLGNVHLVANLDGDWSAGNRHYDVQRAQLATLHQALAAARAAAAARAFGVGIAIVGGDFNVSSSGPLYPMIVDGGAWRDPFAATDPVTFHAEYLPSDATPHRIDYLLIAADEERYPVLETGLLFGERIQLADGRSTHPSDHLGLMCRIAIG